MTPFWTELGIIVITWIAGGGIVYGVTKTRMEAHHQRIVRLETDFKSMVTRTEYESRHADLLRGQQRIENKLDDFLRSK